MARETPTTAEVTELYCWICDDPENCEMCRPEAPGQLELFYETDDGD